jgi:hypothetical protein
MPAMLAHARAALAALLLLCAAASASAAASDAKAASASDALETMDIASWTLEQKAFGAPHTRAEYELPRGVKRVRARTRTLAFARALTQRGSPAGLSRSRRVFPPLAAVLHARDLVHRQGGRLWVRAALL